MSEVEEAEEKSEKINAEAFEIGFAHGTSIARVVLYLSQQTDPNLREAARHVHEAWMWAMGLLLQGQEIIKEQQTLIDRADELFKPGSKT